MDLVELIRDGDVTAVKAALADGMATDCRDDTGETPLILAAGLGHQELIHHRGQVQSFLRLMGYAPPDIYAPPEAAEEGLAEQPD